LDSNKKLDAYTDDLNVVRGEKMWH
jgi:hypothetical protein